jgi:sugar-specific transcriptional regulator TrmB
MMNPDNASMTEVLLGLGLTKQQAATYLALLKMESVSIRKVAALTGINRGTTYEAMKGLVAIGLARSKYIGKREYYAAESPEKIYDLIREKRKEAWNMLQVSKREIPALLAEQVQPQGVPLVRYYEDEEGVAAILRDVLQTCVTLPVPEYCAYSSQPLRQFIYKKFPQFTERRIAEGISVKVIAIGEGGEITASSERKWIAEPTESTPSSYTLVYGNKVAHISIADNNTPYGVVIEDEGATSMQRLLFKQLWKTL